MLVYYCATNCAEFNVVNGNGWGDRLATIQSFIPERLPHNAAFLDNETGDIYVYTPVSGPTKCDINVGFHAVGPHRQHGAPLYKERDNQFCGPIRADG